MRAEFYPIIFIVLLGAVVFFLSRRSKINKSKEETLPSGDREDWKDIVRRKLGVKEKGDGSSQKMVAYFILLIITFLVFHFSDDSNSFRYTFWVVLIGLHIIWIISFFLFPGGKVSGLTKFVIFGTFAFFLISGIFPNTTRTLWGGVEKWRAEVESGKTGEVVREVVPGVPASIIAVKERPTEWISIPPGKIIKDSCDGIGRVYIRHTNTGPEGLEFPCIKNGAQRDFKDLNNGLPLVNPEVRYQSEGEPFVVYFYDCTLPGSCRMK